jgi:NAD(P)-dependent dehydrogenase (short-subunit alcohol dehydrogenase family)
MYRELLGGRFRLTKVVRIDHKDDGNFAGRDITVNALAPGPVATEKQRARDSRCFRSDRIKEGRLH